MITPTSIVNSTIKPYLVKDFGIAVSTLILLQNSKKCDVLIANLDREGYIKLVESVVSDYRLTKTLDKDEIALRKREWLSFVSDDIDTH